jgi:hypothetical protein
MVKLSHLIIIGYFFTDFYSPQAASTDLTDLGIFQHTSAGLNKHIKKNPYRPQKTLTGLRRFLQISTDLDRSLYV